MKARVFALTAVLAFIAQCVGATQAQSTLPAISATPLDTDQYPPHNASFPGGVTGVPDVTYTSQLGFRPQTLDLYLPPDSFRAEGPRPFVVFVHGGTWIAGTARGNTPFSNWPAALASIAAKGYVVASIGYTLLAEARFPAAIYDVKDAIRFLRRHAALYSIDTTRGLIWGSSAGGQLAALAAASCDVKELDRPKQPNFESACVQGAVFWYGVSDFAPFSHDKLIMQFLGCSSDATCPARVREASPVTYIDAKTPPFLIVTGTDDRTVPAKQSQELYDTIIAKKGRAELLLLPGIDHNFVGKTPEATRDASLQAWQRTLTFIDRTIGARR